MPATFSQQLRYLRRNEPSLYESISKAYRKCLMESNLAPQMNQTDDEAAETPIEKDEIKQTNTKGVNDLMSKVHAMVGQNMDKKEGDEIFDLKDNNIETVQPDPQQQADLLGQEPPPAEPVDNSVAQEAPVEETPVEAPGDIDLDNLFPTDGSTEEQSTEPAEQPAETPPQPTENIPADQQSTEGGEDVDLGNLF